MLGRIDLTPIDRTRERIGSSVMRFSSWRKGGVELDSSILLLHDLDRRIKKGRPLV